MTPSEQYMMRDELRGEEQERQERFARFAPLYELALPTQTPPPYVDPRTPAEIWAKQVAQAGENFEGMPAYQALKKSGMDRCGLTQLASRTVGVPFVGLIAACLSIAEILRRLNGGVPLEFLATSAASLSDVEFGTLAAVPYAHGYVRVNAAN